MADYRKAIPHVLKWEGGYSAAQTDDAKYDSTSVYMKTRSGNFRIHTNKGITWGTWKSVADSLGLEKTENAFLNMTDEEWGKVFKKKYWDYIQADKIISQPIAEFLVEMGWGSGFHATKGAGIEYIQLQNYLNKRGYNAGIEDGYIGTNTIKALNAYLQDKGAKGESELLDFLFNARDKSLKRKSSAAANYKGWYNRIYDHYTSLKSKLGKFAADNPTGTGLVSSVILLAGIFFLVKKFRK